MSDRSYTVDIKVNSRDANVSLATFHETTKKVNSEVDLFNKLLKEEERNLKAFQQAAKGTGANQLIKNINETTRALKDEIKQYGRYNKAVKEATAAEKASARVKKELNSQISKRNKTLRSEREAYDSVYAAEQRYARAIGKIHKSYVESTRKAKSYAQGIRDIDRQFASGNITATAHSETIKKLQNRYRGSIKDMQSFTATVRKLDSLQASGSISTDKYRESLKKLVAEQKKGGMTSQKYINLLKQQEAKLAQATGHFGRFGKSLDNVNIKYKKLAAQIRNSNSALGGSGGIIKKTGARFLELGQSLMTVKGWVQVLHATWKLFFAYHATMTFGHVITSFARMGESVELLDAKIKYFTKDGEGLSKMSTLAYEVGVNLDSLGKVITRFSVSTKGAYNVDDMLTWAEGLVKAARAVGTTNQELQSGMIQITQAMSAGRLMGDEFRSVSENIPMLRQVLDEIFDERLGSARNSLKQLAADGKITVDVLVEAFHRLNEQVQDIPGTTETIDAGFERLKVSFSLFAYAVTEGGTRVVDILNSLSSKFLFLAEIGLGKQVVKDAKITREEMAALNGNTREYFKLINQRTSPVDNLRKQLNELSGASDEMSKSIKDAGAETVDLSNGFVAVAGVIGTSFLGMIGSLVYKFSGLKMAVGLTTPLLKNLAEKLFPSLGKTMVNGKAKVGLFAAAITFLGNKLVWLYGLLLAHPVTAAVLAITAGIGAVMKYVYALDTEAERLQKVNDLRKTYLESHRDQYATKVQDYTVDNALASLETKGKLITENTKQLELYNSKIKEQEELVKNLLKPQTASSEFEKRMNEAKGIDLEQEQEKLAKMREHVDGFVTSLEKLKVEKDILSGLISIKAVDEQKVALQGFMDQYTQVMRVQTDKEKAVESFFVSAKIIQKTKDAMIDAGAYTDEYRLKYEEMLRQLYKTKISGKAATTELSRVAKAQEKYRDQINLLTANYKAGIISQKQYEQGKLKELQIYEKTSKMSAKELKNFYEMERLREVADKKRWKALEISEKAYEKMIDRQEELPKSAQLAFDAEKKLEEAFFNLAISAEEYMLRLELIDEAQLNLRDNELGKEFEVLSYEIVQASKSIEKLNHLYSRGLITNRKYADSLYDIKKAMLEQVAASEELGLSITDIALSFDEFTRESGENFKSLFSDVFAGTEDAFESFTERMERLFTDMLADMAYQAFLNPIIVSIQQSVIGAGVNAASGSTQSQGASLTSMAKGLTTANTNILGGGAETSWANIKNLVSGQPVVAGYAPGSAGEMANFMTADFNSISNAGISNTYGLSAGANLAGAGILGNVVASNVGGWEGVAAGGLTSVGTVALSGALFGSGAAGAGMAGATAALGAIGPVGWAALAVSLIVSSGLLGGNSDITPDITAYQTTAKKSRIVATDTEEGETDIQFLAGGRYGGFGIMTQHDYFSSQDDAERFYEEVSGKLKALDDAIFMAVSEETNELIENTMKESWLDISKWEDGGFNVDDIMEKRFDKIFSTMNDPLGEMYFHLKDLGLAYDESIKSSILYNQAIEESQILMSDLWDNNMQLLVNAGQENETFADTAFRLVGQLQILNPYMDAIGQSMFEMTVSGADAADSLVKIAGGLDVLLSKMDYYYSNFFSAEEQFALAMSKGEQAISDFSKEWEVGFLTKESLRELATGLDLTTKAEQEFFVALMNIAPLVNDYYGAIDELAKKQQELNDEIEAFNNALLELKNTVREAQNQLDEMIDILVGRDSDVQNELRNLNDLIEKYELSGDAAYISSQDLAIFISGLDASDESVRNMIPDLQSFTSSIDKLAELAVKAAINIGNAINTILNRSGNPEIDSLQSQITLLEAMKQNTSDISDSIQDAYESDMERYEAAIEHNETIMDFLDSLKISDLKSQSPYEQMMEASALFYKAVNEGDADKATGYAEDFLGFAQQYYASTDDYGKVYDAVVGSLEDMLVDVLDQPTAPSGGSSSDISDSIDDQISKLEAQIDYLENIDANQKLMIDIMEDTNEIALKYNVHYMVALQDILAYYNTTLTDLMIASGSGTAATAELLGITKTDVVAALNALGEDIYASDEKLGQAIFDPLVDFKNDLVSIQTDTWTMIMTIAGSLESLSAATGMPIQDIVQGVVTNPEIGAASTIVNFNDDGSLNVESSLNNLVSVLTTLYNDTASTSTMADYITDKYFAVSTSAVEQFIMDYWGFDRSSIDWYNDSVATYETGTSYVPDNMLAGIHKGEMIIDPKTAAQLRNYGIQVGNVQSDDEIIEELRQLRQEVTQLREVNAYGFKESIKHGKRVADSEEQRNERERIDS